GPAVAHGLVVLAVWILGLTAVLVWLEKRPMGRQVAASVRIEWSTPFDRVGALFGPRLGPLVAHWLCFYGRNARTRTMAMMAVPMAGFFTYTTSRNGGPDGLFVAALGTV